MSGTTIATARSVRGEVVLRTRDDGALELRVNGVFVMDTAETSSEQALADLALTRLARVDRRDGEYADRPARILVGGLGLGFTMGRLLDRDPASEIVVVEIEGALIDWHRRGLIAPTAGIIDDPRLSLVEGDVREIVGVMPPVSLDAIVLDVDNGPGFLVYDANAAVYEAAFLATCRRVLRDSGALVVWSADEAPALEAALRGAFALVEHESMPVALGTRNECYHTYVATTGLRPAGGETGTAAGLADTGASAANAGGGSPCPAR